MNAKMTGMESQLNNITAFLKGETKTIGGSPIEFPVAAQPAASAPIASAERPFVPTLQKAYTDEMLEKMRPGLEAKMQEVLANLSRSGMNVEQLPAESKAIFANPVQALKDLQDGKYGKTFADQLIQRQAARKAARSEK